MNRAQIVIIIIGLLVLEIMLGYTYLLYWSGLLKNPYKEEFIDADKLPKAVVYLYDAGMFVYHKIDNLVERVKGVLSNV